jgi:hypothetical protein
MADNAFVDIADFEKAQEISDSFVVLMLEFFTVFLIILQKPFALSLNANGKRSCDYRHEA